MEIPSWAKKTCKGEHLDLIQASLAKAESTTSAEIVPMIVRRSSTIGHVPALVFCLLTILYFVVDGPGLQLEYLGDGSVWYLLSFAVLLVVTPVFSRSSLVQRLLTAKGDQIEQVELRAEVEFYEMGVHQTEGGTGVLLLVSLMEHRAVVLADKAIAEKLPENSWEEICKLLVDGIKNENIGDAFQHAIAKTGALLDSQFPIQPGDVNEIKDQLIIKE